MFDALTERIRPHLPHNRRINRLVNAAPLDRLKALPGVNVEQLNLSFQEHETWMQRFLPDHVFSSLLFKKPIEFFATYKLLNPGPEDVFLDAAGGVYTYLHRIPVRTRIMQDLTLPDDLKNLLGTDIQFVESDAGDIPLPSASIDKISCHHSFEHFEGDADTRFIKEVQRLLRPRGRACILPIFVANQFFELTNHLTFSKKFDPASVRVVDLTATLPGGNGYARVYDPAALQRRVLSHIDRDSYQVTFIELSMEGRPVPDLDLPANRKVASINSPFRALVIDRF